MLLIELSPTEVLNSEWVATYEKEIDIVWQQLVALHTNIFIFEKIVSFPFRLFRPVETNPPFWWAVKRGLLYESIMIIWRITDYKKKSKYLSLRKIRDGILDHLSDKMDRSELDKAFETHSFTKRCEKVGKRIAKVRHNFVAHLAYKANVQPDLDWLAKAGVSLPDLRSLHDELESLFNLLCLDTHRSLSLWSLEMTYDWLHQPCEQSEVDNLLDCVAKNSPILNLPENWPERWSDFRREGLSQDDLDTLNEYRRKFGLSEVW